MKQENTKKNAYESLAKLIDKFRSNYDEYKNQDYNETKTRIDFINPFFEIFNWDIDNKNNLRELNREVVHEANISVKEKNNIKRTKCPDYLFRQNGKGIFFVEAKKPFVNIKDDIDPAYQLRRYGWSAKFGISILTDFEEFAIYDCTKKPNLKDNASHSRLEYFHYENYLERFDFLWDNIEKNNVLNGSLNEYSKNIDNKKGTDKVDDEFLKTLDTFRTLLASNVSKLNSNLNSRDINLVVQNTIDRIIFLRIAEDRGIEKYGILEDILKDSNNNYYLELYKIFENADSRYNSGLFDLKKDAVSKSVVIDDKIIKNIIKDLYYPNSPYELSVLPVEILGSAYEQFLGKTITLDKNHKAKIEYKPEVRKAGGVYYTPQYIVDYIVENTVGVAIKNKTPKQIEAIKIVDPSCGSGSFLIGAYNYLLDFHYNYYTKNPPSISSKKESPINDDGSLTVNMKKRILVNNIFGVDIDMQAVEVTKLSLMLKCLEGESNMSLESEKSMFGERALPSMEDNIKCGNSLIGTDFYDNTQATFDFDTEEMLKINAFDWKSEFSSIFSTGGFDVVIGNPPYIFARNEMFTNEQKEYYYSNYPVSEYQLNTYLMFTEKAHSLVNDKGLVGFIIPNNCLTINSFDRFRRFIVDKMNYLHIINSYDKVFSGANVDTCILVFSKSQTHKHKHTMGELRNNIFTSVDGNFTDLLKKNYIININQCLDPNNPIPLLMDKINELSSPISEYANIYDGLKTYEIGKGTPPQTVKDKISNRFLSNEQKDTTYAKMLSGSDVQRYCLEWSGNWISYGKWLAAPRKNHLFKEPRILVRQVLSKYPYFMNAVYTNEEIYNEQSAKIIREIHTYEPLFILGIINSKLTSFWLETALFKSSRAIFPRVVIKELAQFPIPNIDLNNKGDKDKHDELVKLVTAMIDLNKKIKTAGNQVDEKAVARIIEATDRKIDSLVYSLYNLSDDDVKVIEGV